MDHPNINPGMGGNPHQIGGEEHNAALNASHQLIFKRLGAMFLMLLGFAGVRLLLVGETAWQWILGTCLTLLGTWPLARGAWRAWRWLTHHRRMMRNRCIHCGYDMKGLWQQRCPECGKSRDGGL